ncbi:MAG TPA: enoyl-CoA hydratase-related protein [Dehalococcoidales bacterium]|nr:enoyl-CoA hydratase-related protein [Dehalococcoidales bacterium]
MADENIIYEVTEGICKITLNRPKALNALNLALLHELKEAVVKAVGDPAVELIILTGAGRAFSAGVDISGTPEDVVREKPIRYALAHAIIDEIQRADKVVIAMVNGHCLTGALELALSCDLIIASTEAKFGDTHARWGLIPAWGMSQRLPLAIGLVKARELSFTAEIISAEEAGRIGLVNTVVAPDKLEETVKTLAKKITSNSKKSIAAIKRLYNQGQLDTMEKGLKLETEYIQQAPGDAGRLDKFSRG